MAVNKLAKIGSWSFIIGVILALIGGFIAKAIGDQWTTSILIVLGLIVGFLNVTGKESVPFLMAAVSLVIVASFGGQILGAVQIVGPYIQSVLAAMLTFTMAATIVVALKAIYALAKDA